MLLAVGGHVLGELEPQSLRMATGFGGGLGETEQEMCGALSGGVMVIGGQFGRTHSGLDDGKVRTLARRYRERFLTEFGHTQCASLRERVVLPRDGLGSCEVLVQRAAELLLSVLEEDA